MMSAPTRSANSIAGLQAGALPEIDRMLDHDRAGFGGDAAVASRRAIIDDDRPDNRRARSSATTSAITVASS